MRTFFFLTLLIVFLSACNSLFIDEDVPNTFEGNFQVFWEEMDRHYAYFDIKGVDWQAAYDTNIQTVRGFTQTSELSTLLSELTLAFEDGHVNLFLPNQTVAFNFREGFPENDPGDAGGYLDGVRIPNATLFYGSITGTDLGYIRVSKFNAPFSDYEVIDEAIAALSSKTGIVVDVRNNGGGSDRNGRRIASRFADERRVFQYVRYRNGSRHDEFTDWRGTFIQPEGITYTKPVAVLTNRGCYSATESFILSMNVMPHVTVVGGITGGGSGNPIYRQLPNGWDFRLSSWQQVDEHFQYSEGRGIIPEVLVNIPQEDIDRDIDTILASAIALLQAN